ncbi:MAG: hypothetical protein E7345_04495 [Clostridiales bacterium]|nr:hypothetical protein [Clostridiales bacterium]
MKFWVKIIVALLVVVTIGFAVWAFFFREKDEVAAYNRTADFVNYKYSLNLDKKLDDLAKLDYLKNDTSMLITPDTQVGTNIIKVREQCLSPYDIVLEQDSVEIYRYQSYVVLEDMTDEIIYDYLPYLNSNVVNNSAKKKVLKAVEDYTGKIGNLTVSINEVVDCQTNITNDAVQLEFLYGKYLNFKNCFRNALNSASNLIIAMQNYANICLYNDDIKIDALNMSYDSFARLLNSMTTIDEREEIDYAKSVNRAYKRIIGLQNNEDVFNGYSEFEVLKAYNTLLNNHVDTLNSIFNCRDYDKSEMAKGGNMSLIKTELRSSVQIIFKSMGY